MRQVPDQRVRRLASAYERIGAGSLVAGAVTAFAIVAVSGLIGATEDRLEAAYLLAFLGLAVLGAAVLWQGGPAVLGWTLLLGASAVLISSCLDTYAHLAIDEARGWPGARWARWVQGWLYAAGWGSLTTLAIQRLPDGALPSRRWRPLVWASAAAILLTVLGVALRPGRIGESMALANPVGIEVLSGPLEVVDAFGYGLLSLLGIVSLAAPVLRWRRANVEVRRQLAWVLLGLLAVVVAMMTALLARTIGLGGTASTLILAAGLASLPTMLAIAILRERLFDIDVVLSRGYLLTTVSLVTISALVSALVATSRWVDARAGVAASLLVTICVGIALANLWRGIERWTARRLLGAADLPAELAGRIERIVQGEGSPAACLQQVAAELHLTTRASSVEVRSEDGTVLVSWGAPRGPTTIKGLAYRGRSLGNVILTGAGADVDQLLEVACPALVTALSTLGLHTQVQEARQDLVRDREWERLRLKRDLHDGVGPLLAAATLQADALGNRLAPDDVDGADLVRRLRSGVAEAMTEVRALIDELRPAVLDQLGLAAAVAEHGRRLREGGVVIDVEVEPVVDALDPATTLAAYRIIIEAMTNVLRHARAETVCVRAEVSGDLLLISVEDDGCGFSPGTTGGIGLWSMSERAAELGGSLDITCPSGGGSSIRATIPVGAAP